MIGYYNYSVILTYAGLCAAIWGMILALEQNPRAAVLCLLVCGLCDMFDGTIARKCKRSDEAKCFGVQIDSLCDLVCFGVFPAVLCYSLSPRGVITLICMALYVLAAVVRLGYFNVQEIGRPKDQKRAYYEGLPVTSAALIVPVVILLCTLVKLTWGYAYPILLFVLGAAFVSRFKVKKPYMVGLSVLAVVGLVVFYLVYRYGGLITCMRSFTALA